MNDSKIEGIISAGFGKGYQTREVSKLLNQAVITRKIPVIRCTRSGIAVSNRDTSYDDKYGFINASQFSPHKASILLSVCLAHSFSHQDIQRVFEEL